MKYTTQYETSLNYNSKLIEKLIGLFYGTYVDLEQTGTFIHLEELPDMPAFDKLHFINFLNKNGYIVVHGDSVVINESMLSNFINTDTEYNDEFGVDKRPEFEDTDIVPVDDTEDEVPDFDFDYTDKVEVDDTIIDTSDDLTLKQALDILSTNNDTRTCVYHENWDKDNEFILSINNRLTKVNKLDKDNVFQLLACDSDMLKSTGWLVGECHAILEMHPSDLFKSVENTIFPSKSEHFTGDSLLSNNRRISLYGNLASGEDTVVKERDEIKFKVDNGDSIYNCVASKQKKDKF